MPLLEVIERVANILSIAAIPVVLAVFGWIIQNRLASQTLAEQYVELAVSILKEPPDKEESARDAAAPFRDWAVNLLNAFSPVKFDPEVAERLRVGDLVIPSGLVPGGLAALANRAIAISPDGQLFVAGHEDGTLALWRATHGMLERRYEGHEGLVTGVAFSPNGRALASTGMDGYAKIWNLVNIQEEPVLLKHDAPVVGLSYSPEARMLYTATEDGTITQWDTEAGDPLMRYRGFG